LIEFLAFHDHHWWKRHEICARKGKNKSEKRKKNEEQLREKKRKELDPKACTTSNYIYFCTKVTD